jgi:hypothetical protein
MNTAETLTHQRKQPIVAEESCTRCTRSPNFPQHTRIGKLWGTCATGAGFPPKPFHSNDYLLFDETRSKPLRRAAIEVGKLAAFDKANGP